MKIYKSVKVPERVEKQPVGYICNRCERKYLNPNMPPLSARVDGSFDSPILTDLIVYEFDLCESCIAWLFSHFARPPLIWERHPDGDPSVRIVNVEAELKEIQERDLNEEPHDEPCGFPDLTDLPSGGA